MKRDSKKLVLRKQTVQNLTTGDLHKAGGGYYRDSVITCDMGCVYWSIFTR
jgi:hypothetical protein